MKLVNYYYTCFIKYNFEQLIQYQNIVETLIQLKTLFISMRIQT